MITTKSLAETKEPLSKILMLSMKAPKKEPQLGVHVFKVSLGKSWRQIAIKGDVDFHSFGDVILYTS